MQADKSTGKCQACHSLEPGKNTLRPEPCRKSRVRKRRRGSPTSITRRCASRRTTRQHRVGCAALDAYLLDPRNSRVPRRSESNAVPGPENGERTQGCDRLPGLNLRGSVGRQQLPNCRPRLRRQRPSRRPPSDRSATFPTCATPCARESPKVVWCFWVWEERSTAKSIRCFLPAQGQVVQITLINGEGAEHDVVFPDFDAKCAAHHGQGREHDDRVPGDASRRISLDICSVPGHQLAGMHGQFLVTPTASRTVGGRGRHFAKGQRGPAAGRQSSAADRARRPDRSRASKGAWQKGPPSATGPSTGRCRVAMLRVRVGDTLDVHVKNSADSSTVRFRDDSTPLPVRRAALAGNPGRSRPREVVQVQSASCRVSTSSHCATPMVAHHIANGMYGLILVEARRWPASPV